MEIINLIQIQDDINQIKCQSLCSSACRAIVFVVILGRFCHQAQTPCDLAKDSSNPVCQNGGTCVPSGDSYFCSCAPGYTG